MRPRLRLLPAVLFVGGMLFTVRAGDLWHEVSVSAGGRTAAETVETEEPAPDAPDRSAGDEAAAGDGASAADHPMVVGPTPQDGRADPFAYTDEEVEILQALAKRREELLAREQEIEQRAALLAAAEKRMDDKLEDLKALQATIQALVKQHDAEEEQKFKSLVKIYENMKPRDAAQIFEELEMDVLLAVVGRMSERKAAPILAQMDPGKAKEVTLELAHQRQLPMPK